MRHLRLSPRGKVRTFGNLKIASRPMLAILSLSETNLVSAFLHTMTHGAVAVTVALGAVAGHVRAQASRTVDHAVVEGSINDLQQAMSSGRFTAVQL